MQIHVPLRTGDIQTCDISHVMLVS